MYSEYVYIPTNILHAFSLGRPVSHDGPSGHFRLDIEIAVEISTSNRRWYFNVEIFLRFSTLSTYSSLLKYCNTKHYWGINVHLILRWQLKNMNRTFKLYIGSLFGCNVLPDDIFSEDIANTQCHHLNKAVIFTMLEQIYNWSGHWLKFPIVVSKNFPLIVWTYTSEYRQQCIRAVSLQNVWTNLQWIGTSG